MNADEREMLIRVDETMKQFSQRHNSCSIPNQVRQLERKNDRVEGMIALILFLVAVGRVWDIYEFIRQYIFHIG
jgi:hypothetical protein